MRLMSAISIQRSEGGGLSLTSCASCQPFLSRGLRGGGGGGLSLTSCASCQLPSSRNVPDLLLLEDSNGLTGELQSFCKLPLFCEIRDLTRGGDKTRTWDVPPTPWEKGKLQGDGT